jgi:hypothetical protein
MITTNSTEKKIVDKAGHLLLEAVEPVSGYALGSAYDSFRAFT